jgi:Protein of unknown function (DUF4012)
LANIDKIEERALKIWNSNRVRIQEHQLPPGDPNNIDWQNTQQIAVQRRKRPPKRRYVLLGILLFLFLAGSISSVLGYPHIQTDLSFAQIGMQHLQKAESLLTTWSKRPSDTQLTNQAENEFASAFMNFARLNNDLAASPGLVEQIPVLGARLNSAQRLVPLAMTLSQAGVTGCGILNTLAAGLHDPLSPQAHGITQSDLDVVSKDVKELKSEFVIATQQVNQLQPGDLQFDARLPKLIGTLHKYLPAVQGWIDTIQQLLPVAPTLLGIGTPTNYLIEVLDSTELRPGGGFIGNYGTATLSGGRLAATHITDVVLLDRPFEAAGHVIPFPAAYKWFDLVSNWSLRDSNLVADFPTAAQYGEQNYFLEGGKGPVQGVIAITPALIEHALEITGPIAVPEYHETVTAQNLIARIHYHQLGGSAAGEGSSYIPASGGHSSQRKRFTELLSEHLLARVRQLPSSDLSKFLLLMVNSLRSKDIQIYFNSDIAENLLHKYHLDAAIQSPVGDGLLVVDANIAPNKANSFIVNTLDDQVTIDSQGNAIHLTTLQYAWTIAGPIYGHALYRDFVHVYAPPGSILLAQEGWQPRGTSNAFNSEVWMGYFDLTYTHTRTITLLWKVPAAAKKDQSGWHYQYLIQRQAGTIWRLNLHIALPSCATLTNKLGGLISNNRQEVALTQSLTENLNVGADYTCR